MSYFGGKWYKQPFFGGVTRILHKPQGLKINRDLGILLERLIQPEIATLLVFFFSPQYIGNRTVLEIV